MKSEEIIELYFLRSDFQVINYEFMLRNDCLEFSDKYFFILNSQPDLSGHFESLRVTIGSGRRKSGPNNNSYLSSSSSPLQ